MTSPTRRTLEKLRGLGWAAEVTEKWVPHSNSRSDLFGFIDIVAMKAGSGIMAVQATGGGNGAARVAKILGECRSLSMLWLESGGMISVWDWKRYKVPAPGTVVSQLKEVIDAEPAAVREVIQRELLKARKKSSDLGDSDEDEKARTSIRTKFRNFVRKQLPPELADIHPIFDRRTIRERVVHIRIEDFNA